MRTVHGTSRSAPAQRSLRTGQAGGPVVARATAGRDARSSGGNWTLFGLEPWRLSWVGFGVVEPSLSEVASTLSEDLPWKECEEEGDGNEDESFELVGRLEEGDQVAGRDTERGDRDEVRPEGEVDVDGRLAVL